MLLVAASSYIIYLFHTTFEGFAKAVCRRLPLDSDLWYVFVPEAIVVITCGLVVPIILFKVFKRYKFTRMLFGLWIVTLSMINFNKDSFKKADSFLWQVCPNKSIKELHLSLFLLTISHKADSMDEKTIHTYKIYSLMFVRILCIDHACHSIQR